MTSTPEETKENTLIGVSESNEESKEGMQVVGKSIEKAPTLAKPTAASGLVLYRCK